MSSSGVTCLGAHFINPAVRQADFCHGLLAALALAEAAARAWRRGALGAGRTGASRARLAVTD